MFPVCLPGVVVSFHDCVCGASALFCKSLHDLCCVASGLVPILRIFVYECCRLKLASLRCPSAYFRWPELSGNRLLRKAMLYELERID